jgi:NAD(P)-dependent dehydrogenase (short-subunit alcohol dehydrogenase family)
MKRGDRGPRGRGSATPLLVAVAAASLLAARRRIAERGYRLEGRVVLITGSSRGLGLALALQMASEGARLVLCGRDPESLARAVESVANTGAEVVGIPVDVTNAGSVADMIAAVRERYGHVDVLVNNAGVIEVGPAETMSLADYEEAMATNFWGMLYPTLALLPDMRARGSGRIVNITSIGGKLGIPHLLPYSASKFAAVGFSQGLRAELAADGIKVVTVCPGLMRTGSPRNAIFRGRHRSEYAWFSISDALPGLSISAASAARRIVAACRRGDAEVLFPFPAKAAAVVNTVAPGLTSGVLAAVDRLLPSAKPGQPGRRRGADSQSWISPSWLTRLGDRAARKYNQIAPSEGATT